MTLIKAYSLNVLYTLIYPASGDHNVLTNRHDYSIQHRGINMVQNTIMERIVQYTLILPLVNELWIFRNRRSDVVSISLNRTTLPQIKTLSKMIKDESYLWMSLLSIKSDVVFFNLKKIIKLLVSLKNYYMYCEINILYILFVAYQLIFQEVS